jgi:ribonucleoside-diphosphate reductase beta chain
MHLPEFGQHVLMKDRRLVMGPPTQALLPMKYKWLYNIFDKANNNFWLPRQIGMQDDKYEYTQLPPNAAHFYDYLFSMLTTMDLVVTDALEATIMPWATAPEFRSWLALQGYQEAIHSDSYTLIAQEIAADEDRLFGMYLTERPIYDKIAMAARYNERIEQALYCTNDEEALRGFIVGYAFWAIMLEGIWFFLGLSIGGYPVAQYGKMRGTGDQFNYIRRDENLHYHTGISIIQNIISENPGIWTSDLVEEIKGMVEEGLDLEKRFAEAALVELPGLSSASYMQECRYQAMVILRRLGIDMYTDSAQTLKWLTALVDLRKEKNFFETHVDEYQTGVNLFEDADEQIPASPDGMDWDDPVRGG